MLRILLVILINIFFVLISVTKAQIPQDYNPNYRFIDSWEEVLDLFSKIKSYSDVGEDIPRSIFSKLNEDFENIFPYFPQKPNYKIVYEKCNILTDKLIKNYNYERVVKFKNSCFQPLNNVIQEINSNFSIKTSISANPKSGNAPMNVTLDARNSVDPSNDTIPTDNFFWYYKDTQGQERVIGKGPVVNHTFSQPGTYVVHLTVRSINSQSRGVFDGEDTVTINVGPRAAVMSVYANGDKLKKDYKTKVGTETAKNGVIIDGSGTHPTGGRKIESHTWKITGPGGFDYERNYDGNPGSIDISLPSRGSYNISLTTLDNQGNQFNETYPLVVADPVAVIKNNPQEGDTTTIYSFDASTSYSVKASIESYKWTIFDPNGNKIDTFEGKSFERKFSTPGNYTVRLNVLDNRGNKNQDQVKFFVESTPPNAQFKIEPVEKRKHPSKFILDASSSYDVDAVNGDDSLNYKWNFSNNQNVDIEEEYDDGKRVLVSFNEKGVYKSKLTVEDDYGKITEKNREIEVKSSLRPKPVIDPMATTIGNRMIFSVNSNKEVLMYKWEFGDGSSKETQSERVKHTYDEAGAYEITLVARTRSGETNEVKKTVFVGERGFPIAAYEVRKGSDTTLSSDATCIEDTGNGTKEYQAYSVNRYEKFTLDASISRNSKGGNNDLSFNFRPKNGQITEGNSFQYEFSEVGCHYVKLWVEDENVKKTVNKKIWFKVKNALPTLDNLSLSFPQYSNQMGVGFRNQRQKDIFRTDYDPLIVEVNARNVKDPDGYLSHFVWYYYKTENPDNYIEVKITPSNIKYGTFAIPRRPGEYSFGVKAVDNDGGEIKSQEILGQGPTVFFPPDTKNPDIPIVTLKTQPLNTKVGEEVKLSVESEILSDRSDFKANRVIKYDFDGDGIYDLTTKKDNVTYKYDEPGSYKPKAKVVYRGYAGIDYSEVIEVKKGLKVNYMYDTLGTKAIFRDVSYGAIENKTFCMNIRKCKKDKKYNIENKDYFIFDYNSTGKYYTSLLAKDKYGNKSKEVQKIQTKSEKTFSSGVSIVSLPKYEEVNGNYTIDVGTNLNNSILFYVRNNTEGKCFVDTDISLDSDGDGNPEKDKDMSCGKLKMKSYNPQFSSTVARIYYGEKGNYKKKDITINFLDVEMSLSNKQKKLYEDITTIVNSLEEDSQDVSYLKTLLLNLRNNLGDKTEIDSLIIQIKDWLDNNPSILGESMKSEIKSVTDRLSDKAVQAAISNNKYDKAKANILIFTPQSIKSDIRELFSEIENSDGSKEDVKSLLEKILKIENKKVEEGKLDEADMNIIKSDICNIVEYYGISSKSCGTDSETEQTDSQQQDNSSGGIFSTVLNIVLWVLGFLFVSFVGLIIIFAVKAKRQRNEDKEEEAQEKNSD